MTQGGRIQEEKENVSNAGEIYFQITKCENFEKEIVFNQ